MSRVISPEGLPVASGLSREACQRIAFELGDGYTVEADEANDWNPVAQDRQARKARQEADESAHS